MGVEINFLARLINAISAISSLFTHPTTASNHSDSTWDGMIVLSPAWRTINVSALLLLSLV